MDESQAIPIVIVPDGLEIEYSNGKIIIHPSQVYKSVLDFALKKYSSSTILLAPANDFGTGQYEEDVALAYCLDQNPNLEYIYKPSHPNRSKYIDTRGNARELRNGLEFDGLWPVQGIILVSAKLHLRRAKLCFEKEGFKISEAIAVEYVAKTNYKLVNRLWYYKFPPIHRIYEALAIIRDFFRPKRKFLS